MFQEWDDLSFPLHVEILIIQMYFNLRKPLLMFVSHLYCSIRIILATTENNTAQFNILDMFQL